MNIVNAPQIVPIKRHHLGVMRLMILTPMDEKMNARIVATVGPIMNVARSTPMPPSRNGMMAFMTDVPPDAVARISVTPISAAVFLPLLYSVMFETLLLSFSLRASPSGAYYINALGGGTPWESGPLGRPRLP